MTNIGYWTPGRTEFVEYSGLLFIAHSSREAAETSWQNFRNDPEWQQVSRES